MSETKSTFAQLKDAAERAKNAAARAKAQGTMVAREAIQTVEIGAASFAVGFVDQKWGVVDAETGLKQHKINGIPSSLIAGAALKGASAFEVFGDYSRDGFAIASGAIAGWSNTAGRSAAIRFDAQAAKKTAEQKPAEQKVAQAA